MAGYDINVGQDLLPGLLSSQDGLAKLVETVLNQILEAQVTETLGVDRHERSEERQGYRNGYRPRAVYPCGAGDVASTANTGWQFFDGDIQALPAQRTGICAGADGDGGARRIHPQGQRDYRRTVRSEFLEIDGQRIMRRA